jgi:NAD(P)-dependent dehydrogenase (short-subunit alcohol dehydrogenase family)
MQRPDFDLSGQVALVTGAGRGIGRDLARALAACGALVLAGVREPEATDAEWTASEGGHVKPIRFDVTDVPGMREAVDAAVIAHGRIDILVNNAGLGANHDAVDVREADWDEMMAVNLKGVFFASQAVGRHMVERGYGRIVNLSSQAGLVGIRRHAVYSASKGGVNLLTKVLALEWAPYGVTVNAIAPTWIYTPGTAERLDDPAFLADVWRGSRSVGRHDRRRRGRGRSCHHVHQARDGRDPAGRRGLDGTVAMCVAGGPVYTRHLMAHPSSNGRR